MDHSDHVRLLKAGVPPGAGQSWADLGCGDGAFTLALADLLGPGSHIRAIDRDRKALERLQPRLRDRFPETGADFQVADFKEPLTMAPLDGLVMANSLHFVKDKLPVLELVAGYLRPGGRFLLVEYNSDSGNPWVPHPLSFPAWRELAGQAGLEHTGLLHKVPSRFLGEIYSALSLRSA